MKIRPVGPEFFHADRRTGKQTDRHNEANSLFFLNFTNSPKKQLDPRCYVMRRRLVVIYRRFETTYRSHFPGMTVRKDCQYLEDGTDKLSQNVDKYLLIHTP
jgi:hypothetical protein